MPQPPRRLRHPSYVVTARHAPSPSLGSRSARLPWCHRGDPGGPGLRLIRGSVAGSTPAVDRLLLVRIPCELAGLRRACRESGREAWVTLPVARLTAIQDGNPGAERVAIPCLRPCVWQRLAGGRGIQCVGTGPSERPHRERPAASSPVEEQHRCRRGAERRDVDGLAGCGHGGINTAV